MSQITASLFDVMSKASLIILETKQFNHHNTGTLQNVFVIVHQLVNKEAKLSRQQTHRVEEVRNITHYLSSMALSSLGTNITALL